MPYIPNEPKIKEYDTDSHKTPNREILDPIIDELVDKLTQMHKAYGYDAAFAGLFNYTITRMFTKFLLDNNERIRYWHSPIIRGVLQDVGDELYRRVFVPYEDVQIEKNGDVPEYLKLQDTIK